MYLTAFIHEQLLIRNLRKIWVPLENENNIRSSLIKSDNIPQSEIYISKDLFDKKHQKIMKTL